MAVSPPAQLVSDHVVGVEGDPVSVIFCPLGCGLVTPLPHFCRMVTWCQLQL